MYFQKVYTLTDNLNEIDKELELQYFNLFLHLLEDKQDVTEYNFNYMTSSDKIIIKATKIPNSEYQDLHSKKIIIHCFRMMSSTTLIKYPKLLKLYYTTILLRMKNFKFK